MLCPKCGHDMGKRAKCLRCGYTVHDIIPIDPEKIESEETKEQPKTERRVVDPNDVHMSRAGGSIFGDIFGGGIFDDILGSIFGFDDGTRGYEYDPKYYDSFGNQIQLPDEFERESVEIRDVECIEEPPTPKEKKEPRRTPPEDRRAQRPQDHRRKPHVRPARPHRHRDDRRGR